MENKKLTKEQLTKIKEQIEEQLNGLKKMYKEDVARINAYAPCITLLDAQLNQANEQLKEFDKESKKS